ncbi:hypothetical protein [Dactylosporangium fulvum]|uniref:Uncharacterized protein n=1 Tax=Dactylosporangium fulvum TaxID=53359 RepID=A0ABY5W370_9ACTN|nr:hypothetical protein [Dactylosporangium fulvum]UWP83173.1 hypothetical protein Dfulv_02365 [Dactylosporangium fulvum]
MIKIAPGKHRLNLVAATTGVDDAIQDLVKVASNCGFEFDD